MRQFLFQFFLTWLAYCQLLRGEDTPPAPVPSSDTNTPEIAGQAFVREFVPPAPKPPIPAVLESDVLQRFSKTERGRTITMEELVPLEEPPMVEKAAVPVLSPEEIAARRAEWLEERRAHPVVSLGLSGTVYDHRATLLRWTHGGEEYEAWSNLDFNVMKDTNSVEVGSTTYLIFMMIGDESTTPRIVESGVIIASKVPTIPPIPKEPGFVLVKGNPENLVATGGIRKLHELYRTHKAQFDDAYKQRLRYEAAAKAWEKEHPPQPENVTIRWWRGKRAPQPGPDGQSDTKAKGATP
ncbi:MAG: hypothetical protein WCL49_13700 [bacterium]|jgi:hypothetical protein